MMEGHSGGHGIGEWSNVNLVQRLLVDDVVVAAVVSHVVFGLRHDALALHAANHRRADLSGEHGIFAIRVVAAFKGDVTVDVDEGLQHHVDAKRASVAADYHAVLLGVFAAEGGGKAHGGSRSGRGNTRQHSRRPVGHAKGGDAKPRDTRQEAGLTLIGGGRFGGAVDHGDLLFQRQLAEKLVDTGIACHGGDAGLRQRGAGQKNERNG
jgi:hypothetical protein